MCLPSHKSYPAKLLLFGEYTVTLGSGALAVPFYRRSGHWEKTGQGGPDRGLTKLLTHIRSDPDMVLLFDWKRFELEIRGGLVFRSDIPEGYGLGSSGALVAAVYDRYATGRTDDLPTLKSLLARMEGAFHGASSGIDPLVSYLGKAVFADDDNSITLPRITLPEGLFLLDTGRSRDTGQLVALFRQKMASEPGFASKIHGLKQVNANAIQAALRGEDIKRHFKEISSIQLEIFGAMIPEDFAGQWRRGLETGSYALKLCGAGGGGYLLGLSSGKAAWQNLGPAIPESIT